LYLEKNASLNLEKNSVKLEKELEKELEKMGLEDYNKKYNYI
jgi:hypothetical protein